MTRGAKLTKAQYRVLETVDMIGVGRDWFSRDRESMPHTIGLRAAFDWALENKLIEAHRYSLTELGKAALARATEGTKPD